MVADRNSGRPDIRELKLRSPDEVMRLKHMGSLHQTRISFVRSLIRQMGRENWRISTEQKQLDENGYGYVVYSVETPHGVYSFVAFSQFLDPSERTDRVIAEKWDTAFALVEGVADDECIQRLRENVTKQEVGRYNAGDLVISRANKSVRLFKHVVERLSEGRQPDLTQIAPVGYLLRTTAVYGNGKFGMADYTRIQHSGPFTQSFRVQMLVVYLVRQLSFDLADHVAQARNPEKAVLLEAGVKRAIGVGNATGLGMAPFLMSHPKLINQWFEGREIALARVRSSVADSAHIQRFQHLLRRAIKHFQLFEVGDKAQNQRNDQLVTELNQFNQMCLDDTTWLSQTDLWERVIDWFATNASLEAQECVVSIIIELYPEQVDVLENNMNSDECYEVNPSMRLSELNQLVEDNYGWALHKDYRAEKQCHYFWYRSANKEEPRLGERFKEPGAKLETAVDIGRRTATLYHALSALSEEELQQSVASFLLSKPYFRGIVRRIQSLVDYPYGEIRDNTLAQECVPIDILRAKLSCFGASKFDPKSDRWTRITLFQGAPLANELDRPDADDWLFPVTH